MGCELNLKIIWECLRKPLGPLCGFLSQFGFMPLFSYWMGYLFFESALFKLGLFTLGCSPGGLMSNFWTLMFNGDINLSITMTFMSTVAALGMMPLWMFTLGKTITDRDKNLQIPFSNLIISLITLTIPLGVGIFIKCKRPSWAERLSRIIKPFTFGVLIFFFTIGIYNSYKIFVLMTPAMYLAGFLVAAVGFLFGATFALGWCLKREQIIAISIETAMQNAGTGFIVLKLSLPSPDGDIASLPLMAQAKKEIPNGVMAAPPKPWERATYLNQRPNFNPDQINSFTSPQALYSGASGGGGGSASSSRPPLPPRPTNYASNTISRPMYGGYNSYSGYGGYGGSMYGGYSGYGGYGSYGGYGYNRYGMMRNGQMDDSGFVNLAEESSRQAFQSIESIVHAFGSVSMMLESTYHAVHSSFRAVLGVAEHFSRMKSHFAQIFSALAVVRTLKWIMKKLLYLIGLRSQDPSLEAVWRSAASGAASAQLTEADLKASRSSWPIVMFFAVVFGGPYLIWRLLSSLVPSSVQQKSHGWKRGVSEHYVAVAMYPFEAGNKRELSFQAGQPLFLAPRDQQPQLKGWLLASSGTHVGIIPANYIKILGLRQGSVQPVNNMESPLANGQGRVAPRIPNMPQLNHSVRQGPSTSTGESPVPSSSGIQHSQSDSSDISTLSEEEVAEKAAASGKLESTSGEMAFQLGGAESEFEPGLKGIPEEVSSDSSYEEITHENIPVSRNDDTKSSDD
ncbi:hypothetical protein SK128_012867 [Halocaridina rubra]|uniref:SH3 domain-containing protein n=1 Tax=Halocaridina rubra TaxID=373956 RepID=A0AAN8XTV0_HALRR